MSVGTYTHRALFYETDDELVARLVPFVADGIARDERVVVVVNAATGAKLRRELRPSAEFDLWDANEVYTFPVRTLAAYVDTVVASTERGRRIRVAGEPPWFGRSSLEVAEWTCVEAACNVVFAGADLEMLCPYNTSILDPSIISAAQRTHPEIQRGEGVSASSVFDPFSHQSSVRHSALPPRPGSYEQISIFSAADFSAVMSFVEGFGRGRGMAERRVGDLETAVRELIEHAVDYRTGPAVLRLWTTGEDLVCEVESGGSYMSPFAGYVPSSVSVAAADGLWRAGQSSDLVAVREHDGNSTVRIHFSDYLIAVRPECGGIDSLLGVYVLRSCDAAESARVEAHLVTCVECRAEVGRLTCVVHEMDGAAQHHEAEG